MTGDALRDRCLALMRQGRSMAISGNRESWSVLEGGPGGLVLRHGDVGGGEEHLTPLSDDAAWRLIRTRAAESAFRWTDAEQATQPEAEILDYVASMPRGAGRP